MPHDPPFCSVMQIYGLFLVKLAVAITLIGGCARRDDSGTHIRGECHMLLIGDPGTGKSQVGPFCCWELPPPAPLPHLF